MIRRGDAGAGIPAGRKHSRIFDGLLTRCFTPSMRRWCTTAPGGRSRWPRWAATGEVRCASRATWTCACSCAGNEAESARPIAEALLYPLWDSGLAIGHQVVTADDMVELARTDLPTATTLLDWRTVAGDPEPSQALLARVFEGVFGAGEIRAFLQRLGDRAGGAPRALRRVGVLAGAGRQERPGGPARPGRCPLGGARALARHGARRLGAPGHPGAARVAGHRRGPKPDVARAEPAAPVRGSALGPPQLRSSGAARRGPRLRRRWSGRRAVHAGLLPLARGSCSAPGTCCCRAPHRRPPGGRTR